MFGFQRNNVKDGRKKASRQPLSFESEQAKLALSKKSSQSDKRSGAASSKDRQDFYSVPALPKPSFSTESPQTVLYRLKRNPREDKSHNPLRPKIKPGSSSAKAVNLPSSSQSKPGSSNSFKTSFEDVPTSISIQSQSEGDTRYLKPPEAISDNNSVKISDTRQELRSKWRPWSRKILAKGNVKGKEKGKIKMMGSVMAKCKALIMENGRTLKLTTPTTPPALEMDAVESSRRALENLGIRHTAETLYASQVYELPVECQKGGRVVPSSFYYPSSKTPYHAPRQLGLSNPTLRMNNSLHSLDSKEVAYPDEALCAAASKLETVLVQQILSQTVLNITQAAQNTDSGNRISNSTGDASASTGGEGSSSRRSGKNLNNKRSRYAGRGGQGEDDASGNSDDERRKKGKCKVGADIGARRRRLKCPYFQWRPEEYTLASCRGQGFADMAKLKYVYSLIHSLVFLTP